MRIRPGTRHVALTATLLAFGLLTGACSGSSSGGGTSSSGSGGSSGTSGEQVTLTVNLFGAQGMQEAGLFDEYQKLHPNIKINYTTVQSEPNYWSALQTKLAAGAGLGDIQAFEVGRSVSVTQEAVDSWTDLTAYGADKVKDNFYPAPWSGGVTKDNKILGLPTDIGPMAMCYRKDLLGAAGLPTDRTQLGTAWSTWDKYLALGAQYQAKAGKNAHWVDSAGSLYGAVLAQFPERYYDTAGTLNYETSTSVKTAWDTAMKSLSQGLTAKLQQFQQPWNQAFSTGSFATIACPAWMLNYIKGQAGPKGANKWDIAALPGGSGQWGGAYLGVPAKAKHPKEAAELALWLTAPAQQVKTFPSGHFPSSPQAATDPKVAQSVNAYFSNAPDGQIFSDAAKGSKPQTHGPKDRVVENAITNTGIVSAEQQGRAPAQAWTAAVQAAKRDLG